MKFQRIEPPLALKNLVECYWIVTRESKSSVLQKIIPDGFPEIIFHFGDPYRIKLTDAWEIQNICLLAGQITKYFFLENAGVSDIFGVKLKPAALTQLFGLNMLTLTNKVVPLSSLAINELGRLANVICSFNDHTTRINFVNDELTALSQSLSPSPIEKAIDSICSARGVIPIASICEMSNTSERQLERLFSRHVGLSPKFFSRVVRLSYIFQLAQQKKLIWAEVGLESGFYDQAHFIKDFKSFTGDDPTQYFFNEPSLGNFFLKKA
jgi:AraC-like DNA-binding protein